MSEDAGIMGAPLTQEDLAEWAVEGDSDDGYAGFSLALSADGGGTIEAWIDQTSDFIKLKLSREQLASLARALDELRG